MGGPPHESAISRDAQEALRDAVPVVIAVAPYSLIVGAAAANAGAGLDGAMALSILLFAGASQLAALDLLAHGASVTTAVLTALVINTRFVIYGASLASHLRHEPKRRRALGAYLMSDPSYSVAAARFDADLPRVDPWIYYATVATALWIVWQIGTVVGALVGNVIPDRIPLEFSAPLVFLALLVATLRNRPNLLTALVAGTAAIILTPSLGSVSLPVSSILGLAVGWFAMSRHDRGAVT